MIESLIIVVIIELVFHPRLDFGRSTTLWYTWKKERKYITLWN
jgi:hypothetical protein